MHYAHARYYDSRLSIFRSIDPLAEEYPHLSPYAYCGNNPIRYIDPDGKDVWEVNEAGEIVNRIKDKTQDAFYMVDGDGARIGGQSVTFNYGTIENHRSQSGTYQKRNADDTRSEEVTTIDIFKVRGDKNGTKLFEFFADNTNVEWSQAKTGVKGNKGLNF